MGAGVGDGFASLLIRHTNTSGAQAATFKQD